jgi:hypothetical protein
MRSVGISRHRFGERAAVRAPRERPDPDRPDPAGEFQEIRGPLRRFLNPITGPISGPVHRAPKRRDHAASPGVCGVIRILVQTRARRLVGASQRIAPSRSMGLDPSLARVSIGFQISPWSGRSRRARESDRKKKAAFPVRKAAVGACNLPRKSSSFFARHCASSDAPRRAGLLRAGYAEREPRRTHASEAQPLRTVTFHHWTTSFDKGHAKPSRVCTSRRPALTPGPSPEAHRPPVPPASGPVSRTLVAASRTPRAMVLMPSGVRVPVKRSVSTIRRKMQHRTGARTQKYRSRAPTPRTPRTPLSPPVRRDSPGTPPSCTR